MNLRSSEPRPCVEITVVDVRGSGPREPGARMYWYPDGTIADTIGGGNLEQKTLDEAAALWADANRSTAFLEFPLSAKLGQCCGGHVRVFLAKRVPEKRVVICGAGHVATALASVLATTPLKVTVLDSRAEWADAARFAKEVESIHDDPRDAVRDMGAQAQDTYLLIMTHEHAVDQELCQLALRHPFAWIGLIGSRTKWLRFRQRLAARGFSETEIARITCPIGNPALGRTPKEIAIGVAAQLLGVYHAGAEAANRNDKTDRTDRTDKTRRSERSSFPGKRAALILAGGASRRMGRWKGGVAWEGEPLVAAHGRIFTNAGADVWKAVYPEMVREEAERIIPPGHRILNVNPDAPLFASLQRGLRALIQEHPDIDSVLMTPVDMVPLDEDFVAALWDRHETAEAWATRPSVTAEGAEGPVRFGHPVILGHRLFASILAADPAAARLDFLLRDLPEERKQSFELPTTAPLTNLNTPEDLQDALAE